MLYLITNRNIVKGDFFSVIEEAVEAGVDAIILREKDLNDEELHPMAEKIKKIIGNKNTLLIINGNLKVAKDLCTDGYHIGFDKFIKEELKFKGMLGVSIHSVEEGILAEKKGANYLLASHIFKTDCKNGLKPKGIELIKKLRSNVKIPIIALGGIHIENIDYVLTAGAHGVAVMSAIMGSDDPYTETKNLKNKMSPYL